MTIRLNPNRGQDPTHFALCDGPECSRVKAAPLRWPWRSLTIYARSENGSPELRHFHHGPCMAAWLARQAG